jgi:hypothetical protein
VRGDSQGFIHTATASPNSIEGWSSREKALGTEPGAFFVMHQWAGAMGEGPPTLITGQHEVSRTVLTAPDVARNVQHLATRVPKSGSQVVP